MGQNWPHSGCNATLGAYQFPHLMVDPTAQSFLCVVSCSYVGEWKIGRDSMRWNVEGGLKLSKCVKTDLFFCDVAAMGFSPPPDTRHILYCFYGCQALWLCRKTDLSVYSKQRHTAQLRPPFLNWTTCKSRVQRV